MRNEIAPRFHPFSFGGTKSSENDGSSNIEKMYSILLLVVELVVGATFVRNLDYIRKSRQQLVERFVIA